MTRRFLSTLRARLLALVLLAIIPALGMILLNAAEQRRHAADQATQNALRLARVASHGQQELAETAREFLGTVALFPAVRGEDLAACRTILLRALKHRGHYLRLFVASVPQGNVFCSTLAQTPWPAVADRSYFRRVVETRQFAIGDYQVSRITGKPSIVFAQPVFGDSGQLEAVIGAALDLSWLNRLMGDVPLPPGTRVMMTDRRGTIIASHPDPEAWVGRMLSDLPFFRGVLPLRGERAFQAVGLDGRPRLFAAVPMSSEPELAGFSVIVGIPADTAFAAATRALTRNLVGLVLVTALVGLTAWVASGALVLRPLTRVLAATRRLGTGDLTARSGAPPGAAEIGDLARAFDDMAEALERDIGERTRMQEELERRRQEAELFAGLAQTINASLDLDTVLQRVADGARELCQSDMAEIALRGPGIEALIIMYQAGAASPWVRGLRIEPGKGLGGQVLLSGRPWRTDDYAADPRITKDHVADVRADGVVAVMGVPIKTADWVEGVLYVDNRSPRPFTDRDESVLVRLAEHAAVAIQNARLHAEAERRRREAETLLTVAQSVGSTLDLTETLRRVARELGRLLGADMVGAYVPTPDGTALRALAGYHVPKSRLDAFRGHAIPLKGHPFLVEAWEQQQPVFSNDVPADPRIDREAVTRFPHQSLLVVPLIHGGELLGGLGAVWWHERRVFTPDELHLAAGIGRQATLAVANARLFEASERRRKAAEGLAEVGRLLSESLSVEEVAQRVADSVLALLRPQHVALYRVEPDSMDLAMLALAGDAGPTIDRSFVFPRATGVAGLALRTRRPVVTPDVLNDPRISLAPEVRARIEQAPYRAVVAVPLLAHGNTVGVFSLGDAPGRVFSEDEMALLQAFADQAALALENARLYAEASRGRREAEELARVARTLSESLDMRAVGRRIVESVLPLLSAHASAIGSLRPDGSLVCIASAGAAGTPFEPGYVLPPGVGVAGRAVREGRPACSRDVTGDPEIALTEEVREQNARVGIRGAAVVPLRVQGRIIGALFVADRAPRVFSPREVELLEAFADQAAVALENARLYEETERRRSGAESLAEVARLISRSLDPEEVALRIAYSIRTLLAALAATLYRLDPESGDLVALGVSDAEELTGHTGRNVVLPKGTGLSAVAIREGHAVTTRDVLTDPRVAFTPEARARTEASFLRASLAVPLKGSRGVIGTLTVGDRAGRVFDEEDGRLAEAFADRAAAALENARHYEAAERRRGEAEVFADLAQSISTSLNLDTVLQRVADGAKEVCRADLAEIALWKPEANAMVFRYWAGGSEAYHAIQVEPGKGAGGQVILTGRPFRTDNYAEDGRITKDYLADVQEEGIVAQLIAPIRMDGRVEGLLYVGSRGARRFADEEEALLVQLADHAAIAIGNARLYAEATRRQREAEELARVAGALTESLDVPAVSERIVESVIQLFGAASVTLRLLRADGGLVAVAWTGRAGQYYRPGQTVAGGGWVGARVAREGRPAWTRDATSDPAMVLTDAMRDFYAATGIRAVLAVPLRVKGRVIGSLSVGHCVPRDFGEAEVALLQAFADQAALALENARLYEDAERRRQAAESLAQVGQLISQSLDPREVGQRISDSLATILRTQAASVCELDAASGSLVALALAGELKQLFGDTLVLPPGTGLTGLAVRERGPVVTPDLLQDARVTMPPAYRERIEQRASFRAALAVPLVVKERVIGAVGVADRAGRVFTEDDVRLAQAFADQAAMALENARLFERQLQLLQQTQRQHREAVALEAVGRELASSLDPEQVFRRIADSARDLCRSDLAFLAPYDTETGTATIVAASGARSQALVATRITRGRGIGGKVLETGEPFVTHDYLSDPRFTKDYADVAEQEGIIAEAGVPLEVRGATVGLLCVANRTPRPFEPEDIAVLAKLADQAAIALENSRLYAERVRAEAALRTRARQQAAVAELGQRTLGSADLDAILDDAVRVVAETLGVEYAKVLELTPDGTALTLRAGVGWKPGCVGHATVGAGIDSQVGYTLLADEPVIVEDLRTEARFSGPPILHDHGVVSGLSVVIRGQDGPYGVLGAHTRQRRAFREDHVHFLQAVANVLAGAIGRTRIETALRRHAERLALLHEIDQAIIAARSPEAIAQAALQRIRRVAPCRHASVALFDSNGHEAVLIVVEPPGSILPAGTRFPVTAYGDTRDLRAGQLRAIEDISAVRLPKRVMDALRAGGARFCLAVPLVSRGELVGVLNVLAEETRRFSPEHVESAREVADSLAVAIQDARLFEQVRAARDRLRALAARLVEVQEAERRHIARELHDEIGQTLTALKLTLEMAARPGAGAGERPGDARALDDTHDLVDELMARVRDLSLDLRPAMLDDLGLLPTLLWHLERYTARTGVQVTFRHTGVDRRFRPEVETAAYRIVQEALTNVARHAEKRDATVRLWADAEALGVEVEDQGVGFDAAGAMAAGATGGLAGMQERAALIGGHLTVESVRGAGSRVTAEMPLVVGAGEKKNGRG